jgi:FMN-dependent NADH-azoreductase
VISLFKGAEMSVILHIDSSVRRNPSVTRRLSAEFVERWRRNHPGTQVVYRDLGKEVVPVVTEDWVTATYTPPDARTKEQSEVLSVSDRLLKEFFAADVIVLGVPMYNFAIPANLKAYVDQIVRAGETFRYTAEGKVEGLAKGKKVVVITSRGGDYGPGKQVAALNHQTPYLRTIFNFIGIDDIRFIEAEGQSIPSLAQENFAQAQSKLQELAV